MIIRSIHDILLLPDVSYYFRKEFFKDWTGEDLDTGTEILFALMKEGKEVSEMTEEDFYPIGLLAMKTIMCRSVRWREWILRTWRYRMDILRHLRQAARRPWI